MLVYYFIIDCHFYPMNIIICAVVLSLCLQVSLSLEHYRYMCYNCEFVNWLLALSLNGFFNETLLEDQAQYVDIFEGMNTGRHLLYCIAGNLVDVNCGDFEAKRYMKNVYVSNFGKYFIEFILAFLAKIHIN